MRHTVVKSGREETLQLHPWLGSSFPGRSTKQTVKTSPQWGVGRRGKKGRQSQELPGPSATPQGVAASRTTQSRSHSCSGPGHCNPEAQRRCSLHHSRHFASPALQPAALPPRLLPRASCPAFAQAYSSFTGPPFFEI